MKGWKSEDYVKRDRDFKAVILVEESLDLVLLQRNTRASHFTILTSTEGLDSNTDTYELPIIVDKKFKAASDPGPF